MRSHQKPNEPEGSADFKGLALAGRGEGGAVARGRGAEAAGVAAGEKYERTQDQRNS